MMAFDQPLSNSGSSGSFSSALFQSPNRRVELEDNVVDQNYYKERGYYFGGGSSGCNIIDQGKSCEISSSDQTMMMTMKEYSSKMSCKKHRYAFETRSHVDILDDGYRWRKYGQKAVKNNKFPRSYYRCTHQGCNVKKQIQRVSKDEGVVITTYEGIHSHPIQNTDNFEHILTQMQIYNTN